MVSGGITIIGLPERCVLDYSLPSGLVAKMTKIEIGQPQEGIERAIALTEVALRECDEMGLIFAAIDLSSALDKLMALRAQVVAE